MVIYGIYSLLENQYMPVLFFRELELPNLKRKEMDENKIEHIFSESEMLTCYADVNNKYYLTIPKSSAIAFHILETVNSTTLDKLTFEELDKL